MQQTNPVRMNRLPSVDRVLQTDLGKVASARFGHAATVEAIRQTLARIRDGAGDDAPLPCDAAAIAAAANAHLESEGRPSRWNTLRALRVLDWYAEQSSFTNI